MTIAPSPRADLAEIRRCLDLLAEPQCGDEPPKGIVELRCLGKKGDKAGTVSGYFSDLELLAKAAAAWSGEVDGVYITLNPVLRDLIARACNRVRAYAVDTTKDVHILSRRWLLVDFDPARPRGISSTDQEHDAAHERALACREWLRHSGWPDPIYADSGNGAHLLYRVELPNTAETTEMLKACLQALARYWDDEAVSVDQATFNASRISKLYGTCSAKGDSVPEIGRVHRLARIIEAPAEMLVVPMGGAL